MLAFGGPIAPVLLIVDAVVGGVGALGTSTGATTFSKKDSILLMRLLVRSSMEAMLLWKSENFSFISLMLSLRAESISRISDLALPDALSGSLVIALFLAGLSVSLVSTMGTSIGWGAAG